MKLFFLILLACAFFFYGCPGECSSDGYDEVHIVSTVELDTIVSNISSYESCFEKPFCYQFKIKEDYADSVQLNAFAFDDTLQYLIKHKKWSDIYIVVDTIPIESCKDSHWLAWRGYGHYGTETKRFFSCVFFYEPSCD